MIPPPQKGLPPSSPLVGRPPNAAIPPTSPLSPHVPCASESVPAPPPAHAERGQWAGGIGTVKSSPIGHRATQIPHQHPHLSVDQPSKAAAASRCRALLLSTPAPPSPSCHYMQVMSGHVRSCPVMSSHVRVCYPDPEPSCRSRRQPGPTRRRPPHPDGARQKRLARQPEYRSRSGSRSTHQRPHYRCHRGLAGSGRH